MVSRFLCYGLWKEGADRGLGQEFQKDILVPSGTRIFSAAPFLSGPCFGIWGLPGFCLSGFGISQVEDNKHLEKARVQESPFQNFTMLFSCSSALLPWLVASKKIHIHHFEKAPFNSCEWKTSLGMRAQRLMIQISHGNDYLSAATIWQIKSLL